MLGSNIANFSKYWIAINPKIFLKRIHTICMLYYFELQMAGVILLTAMAIGGFSLWLKRRKERQDIEKAQNDEFGI